MTQVIKKPAFCAQCRSRCGCTVEIEDGKLAALKPLAGHPTGEKLCPKGQASGELIYHPDRLLHPMRRTRPKGENKGGVDPGWERISWDEALDSVADRMKQIAAETGPESTAFSVTTASGTQIADAIPWIERLIRAYGSPNTVYGTEICNWHKDFATRFTFGHDIGVPDFEHTDCVMLWGNNPMATWLARAVEVNKACRRGAKMLVVDPRPTVLARRADVWLQVRPGTDQALALGLAFALIQRGQVDWDYIGKWTNGALLVRSDNGRLLRECDIKDEGDKDLFLALSESADLLRYDAKQRRFLDPGKPTLNADHTFTTPDGFLRCETGFSHYLTTIAAFTPERVQELTGIAPAQLEAAADLLAASNRVAYYVWNGVAQSVTATQTDRALSLLYTLTGSYGRQGGNVPGAAAPFADISGQDLISPEQQAKALDIDQRPLGPPARGWITGGAFNRAVLEHKPYPVRMLMSFGTNMLTSQPDGEQTAKAFEALEFHVHADLFINAAAEYADILLPVSSSWEREGLRTGFDASLQGQRRVQFRQAVIQPLGEARSDIDIVIALAGRLGLEDVFFGLDADKGHDAMLGTSGLSVAELRQHPEGVDLEAEVPLDAFEIQDEAGIPRGFPTQTGLIEVYSEQLLNIGQAPLPTLDVEDYISTSDSYPLRLGCAKTLFYCHGQHRNLPSLRRREPDPPLEISPTDATARGIAQGDWVRIVTERGQALARARIVKDIGDGCVYGQHGWWAPGSPDAPYGESDRLAGNINQVIDSGARDPISGSLALRAATCEVVRLQPGDIWDAAD